MSSIEQAFTNFFNKYPFPPKTPIKVAVALSGGADSLSLLLLTKNYLLQQHPNSELIALTIDHKLRPESSSEAVEINNFCQNLQITHYILPWQHGEITSSIPAKAREARYNLLTGWCLQHGFKILLTGHQLNDQIEQIFIRLSHGASIYGLDLPAHSVINDISILRPLINIDKAACIAYLTERNIQWWEDSSNQKDIFLRNRIRPIANQYLATIEDEKRLKTGIKNIARVQEALNHYLNIFWQEEVSVSPLGYLTFSAEQFYHLPEEIRLSVLTKSIKLIGRGANLKLTSLEMLDHHILSQANKYTAGGCVIEKTGSFLLIYRELGRNLPKIVEATKGAIWDNRFKLESHLPGLQITHLAEEDYTLYKAQLTSLMEFDNKLKFQHKLKILFTLPIIKRLEKLVAIPHINYYNELYFKEIKFVNIKRY